LFFSGAAFHVMRRVNPAVISFGASIATPRRAAEKQKE